MKKILTIAGSDCSGGAGIQADLKTFAAHKTYGMSVITALTAQNTTGVFGIMEASPSFVGIQLDAIFTDIPPDSIKIGMVANSEIIQMIADKLIQYQGKNIVLDPVMVSTSRCRLITEEAEQTLKEKLMPLATLITPNIPEAEVLSGLSIQTKEEMILAAKKISTFYSGGILVKGGHQIHDATDLLYHDGKVVWFEGQRIDNPNTHGTGCTLSSAIACNLAARFSLEESVGKAKEYLTDALKAMLDLGQGSGPLDHLVWIPER